MVALPTVEPQRAVQWLTQGLAGVILLGLVMMVGLLVTGSDRRQQEPAGAQPPALGDVFGPSDVLRPAGAAGAYRIEMRHFGRDCADATTGNLGGLLDRHGCSEVVRAGLISPYEGYQVTAGVFALADAGAAAAVNDLVREQVVGGLGGFRTLPATSGDPEAASVGWHVRDNLLLYCVITRPDGALVPDDDPYAKRITAEIVDNHLGGAAL
ncbi:hypothetical protein Aab01nite_83900 [Paractinoplanes abujensis]|nr:hypothetical protein Aab01nite_83900 [Actinoplanes abujensis]